MYKIFCDAQLNTVDHPRLYLMSNDWCIIAFFDKLCDLVCSELILQAASIGGVENLYGNDEIQELRDSYELVREDEFLEDLYGEVSHLEPKDFLMNVDKKAYWIFDSVEVRKRIHEVAALDLKCDI